MRLVGEHQHGGISIAWAIAKYIHDIDYKPLNFCNSLP